MVMVRIANLLVSQEHQLCHNGSHPGSLKDRCGAAILLDLSPNGIATSHPVGDDTCRTTLDLTGEPVKALLQSPASTVSGHSLARPLAEDTEPAGKNAVHYGRSTRASDLAQIAAAPFRLPQPSTRPGIAGFRRVS
jgi:hypothetical protein